MHRLEDARGILQRASGIIRQGPVGRLVRRVAHYLAVVHYLSGQALGAMDWTTLGILVVVTVGGFIAAPEKIFRREDTPFAYPDAGYFEQFVS